MINNHTTTCLENYIFLLNFSICGKKKENHLTKNTLDDLSQYFCSYNLQITELPTTRIYTFIHVPITLGTLRQRNIGNPFIALET